MANGGYAVAPSQAVNLPKIIVVSGAGSKDADGVYNSSSKEYCDAPVYEHESRGQYLKITREPHKNPKTGAIKHGWLLGQNNKPLYGAPTQSLVVPSSGWKKFGGEEPLPIVKTYGNVDELFYSEADDCRTSGDAAVEQEDWQLALSHFTAGVAALKKASDCFAEGFTSRASLILSRRAVVNMRLKEPKSALRDAVAALEMDRGLSSAEDVAIEAMTDIGFQDQRTIQKILEPIGSGRILDPGAPLILRCIDRWVGEVVDNYLNAEVSDSQLPLPTHMPSDRYLDGLDEETRQAVIKHYIPEQQFGGTGIVSSASECLDLMKKWEEVFAGAEFQAKRKALWDRPMSYPARIQETRTVVAESLTGILEPMGFASGRPGLSRIVKQMQVFWSSDKACANKALDLEEMADVSLADLE